jgi:hypothetical protein
MVILNAAAALATLVEIMALPGALLSGIGGYMWYTGYSKHDENTIRLGKMLIMFGIILLVIVAILSSFLSHLPKV